MKGRLAAPVLIFGLLLLAAGCGEPPASIVLITVDTLRADHLGCYGYFRDTTPTIDRLAADGVLFEHALTPMATTLPAHVSLMTSASTIRHGIKGNFHTFFTAFVTDESLRTAAELFREAGYATAAFVSAAPVKMDTGISAGFVIFDEPPGPERSAAATTNRALAWLEGPPPGPFFIWIHYFDPHFPYAPPAPYDGRYRPEPGLTEFMRQKDFLDPEAPHCAQWNNSYDGEVSYVDDQIGRLLARLRDRGFYESSAIVLASDHGEGLGQHKWIGHGRIFNEQLFVPLIIKPPAELNIEPRREKALVSLMDVLPTLVAALDIPVPEENVRRFEGNNVLAGVGDRGAVLCERTPSEPDRLGPGEQYALTGLRWKYFLSTEGGDALFDMTGDWNETKNVIDSHPDVAKSMRRSIESILESAAARGPGLQKSNAIDPERARQLKGLGY
jgi:arylsulfatase A-like enzyme